MNVLRAISVMVVATGLPGMPTAILSGLEARRQEMAVLRFVGTRPMQVFLSFMSETEVLALPGATAEVGLPALRRARDRAADRLVARELGSHLPVAMPAPADWRILGTVVLAGFAASGAPAFRACRPSLADSLSMRIRRCPGHPQAQGPDRPPWRR